MTKMSFLFLIFIMWLAWLIFQLGRSFEQHFGKSKKSNNQSNDSQNGIDDPSPVIYPESGKRVHKNF